MSLKWVRKWVRRNRFDGLGSANGKALLRVRPLGSAKIRSRRTGSSAFLLAEPNPSNLFYGFTEPISEPVSGTFLLTRPARGDAVGGML
eukprot:6444463-Pyramimonas_sp.AAC.1